MAPYFESRSGASMLCFGSSDTMDFLECEHDPLWQGHRRRFWRRSFSQVLAYSQQVCVAVIMAALASDTEIGLYILFHSILSFLYMPK